MASPKAAFENLGLPQLSDTATTLAAQLLSYIADRKRGETIDKPRYEGARALLYFLDNHYTLPEGDDTVLDTPGRDFGFPGAWSIDKGLILKAFKTLRKETADVQAHAAYIPAPSDPPQPQRTASSTLTTLTAISEIPSTPVMVDHAERYPRNMPPPEDLDDSGQADNRHDSGGAGPARRPRRDKGKGRVPASVDGSNFMTGGLGEDPRDSAETEEIQRDPQGPRPRDVDSQEPVDPFDDHMIRIGYQELQNLLNRTADQTRLLVRQELEREREAERELQRQHDEEARRADAERRQDEARAERLRRAGLAGSGPQQNPYSSDFDDDARSYRPDGRPAENRPQQAQNRTAPAQNRAGPSQNRPDTYQNRPASSVDTEALFKNLMERVRAEFSRPERPQPPQPRRPTAMHPPAFEPPFQGARLSEPRHRWTPFAPEVGRENAPVRKPHFKPERVGFFDPYAEGTTEIVMQGTNRVYRSVHLFLQSARDQAKIVEPWDIRTNLSQCLQGAAAEWFTHQLAEDTKQLVYEGPGIENWEAVLLGKFKMSTTKALKLLEQQYFDFNSVRNNRSIAEFVMTVMRLAREAEFTGDHVKLSQAWSRMHTSMRDVIPRPTLYTSVDDFIRTCEEHEENWQEAAQRNSKRQAQLQPQQQQQTNRPPSGPPGARGNNRYDNRPRYQQERPPFRTDSPQQQSQPFRPPNASGQPNPYQKTLPAPPVSAQGGSQSQGNAPQGRGDGRVVGREWNRPDNQYRPAPVAGGYYVEPQDEGRYQDAPEEHGYDQHAQEQEDYELADPTHGGHCSHDGDSGALPSYQ